MLEKLRLRQKNGFLIQKRVMLVAPDASAQMLEFDFLLVCVSL